MPSGGWTHRWSGKYSAKCLKCGTTRTEMRDRTPRYAYHSAAGAYLGGYASKCPGKRRPLGEGF